MKNLILALDFVGTKLAAAIVDPSERKWLAYRRAVSPADADAKSDIEIMFALAHELLSAQPAAIGVSFGGPVDASPLGQISVTRLILFFSRCL
jgi:glucokinase